METKKAIEIFKSYRKMRSEKVTSSDRMAIQMLFDESQELVKGKKKPIDWTCGGCVPSAFLAVGNYTDYQLESASDALSELIEESKEKPTSIVMFEPEKGINSDELIEAVKKVPVVKKASNVKKKTSKKK